MTKTATLLAALLLLGACAEQRIAAYTNECAQMGLQPQTAEMAQCVLAKEQIRASRFAAFGAVTTGFNTHPALR